MNENRGRWVDLKSGERAWACDMNDTGTAVLLVDAPTYAKRDGTWTPVAHLSGHRHGDSLASDFLD